MSEDFSSCKIKIESIKTNNEKLQNDNNIYFSKNSYICQILQPITNKILEILKNNGSYSLISCILEIFYDKNINILKKEEILNEIKKVLKNNLKIISNSSENIIINIRNCFFKTNQILDYNENFTKLSDINNSEELIKINIEKLNSNLENIIKELLDININLFYNPKIIIDLEEEKKKREEINNQNELEKNIDKLNNEEIKNNQNIKNKIEEIINTDILPNKRRLFLRKKRKLKNNKLSLPINLIKFNHNPHLFSLLEIESLSFNCIPKKQEILFVDEKINEIIIENEKLMNIYDSESIEEIEENKINDLKKEILEKKRELKLHEEIIQSLKRTNLNSENNKKNIYLIRIIVNEFSINYKELKTQIDILSLYKKYIFKIQKDKNNNSKDNIEIMKNIYHTNFESCKLLINKIENNKNQYIFCLKNLNDFIQSVNNIGLNEREYNNFEDNKSYNYNIDNDSENKNDSNNEKNILNISNCNSLNNSNNKINNNDNNSYLYKNNILIYNQELQIIDKIINSLTEFIDKIKNYFHDCISDTPFEKELNN